jgi:hypothetical protein
MTPLELATILGSRTTAEVEAILPQIVADTGALWFTTGGVSTFVACERAMSSNHGPAEAARLWGVGFLNGEPPPFVPTGPQGMAGVDGEIIDGFVRNNGGA